MFKILHIICRGSKTLIFGGFQQKNDHFLYSFVVTFFPQGFRSQKKQNKVTRLIQKTSPATTSEKPTCVFGTVGSEKCFKLFDNRFAKAYVIYAYLN